MRSDASNGTNGFTRRDVLRAAGAATVVSAASCGASEANGGALDTLVVVFLRGGMDGLSLVVPHGDDEYHKRRRKIAVRKANVHDLDGYFGLNRAAEALLPHYREGRLAIANAVGHMQKSRSHFQSARHVEEAHAGIASVGTGWVARHLANTPATSASPARAIALQSTLPPALQGGPATVPVPKLSKFGFGGPAESRAARMKCLRRMYDRAPEPHRAAGRAALGLVRELTAIDFVNRTPNGGAEYPDGNLGRALYEAASLILNRSGVEVLEVDYADWDDHKDLGPKKGAFAARADEFSRALGAFMTDVEAEAERVTVLVMTEFGRAVRMNGGKGTAHGRASAALVLGGSHVDGGKLHGEWPGLSNDDLDHGALRVTTDIRDVLAEVLQKRLRTGDLAAVLPGHTPTMPGLLRDAIA